MVSSVNLSFSPMGNVAGATFSSSRTPRHGEDQRISVLRELPKHETFYSSNTYQTSQVSTLGLVTVRLSDQKGGGSAAPLSCNLTTSTSCSLFPGSRSVCILAAQRSPETNTSCRSVWLQLLAAGEGAHVRPVVCPVSPFSARLQVLAQPHVAAYRHG